MSQLTTGIDGMESRIGSAPDDTNVRHKKAYGLYADQYPDSRALVAAIHENLACSSVAEGILRRSRDW